MAFTTPVHKLIERNANGLLAKHASWERVRLGDAVTIRNGFPFKSEYFNTAGRGMPLLRIRDIVPGVTETWYDGPYDAEYVVHPGELVIGMDGDFNHALWSGPSALLNQRVCRLAFDADEPLRRMFVLHAIGGYLQAVNDATPSVTVKHLSSKTVEDLLLPLPPGDEQDAIVKVLERLFRRLDEGEQLVRQARRGCNDLRAALLEELLQADAPRARIGDVADVFVGATPRRSDPSLWGSGIPWVSSGEVAFCRIRHTRETISEAGLGNRERRLHPPGTVMLAMIGEGKTRGQAAILDVPAAHNQNSAAIRLHPRKMLPEFLFYCLMAMYEENRRAGGGSQQPALNKELVRVIEVPLPTLDEQTGYVAGLESHLPRIGAYERGLDDLVRRSSLLRRSLLMSALRGELCSARERAVRPGGTS